MFQGDSLFADILEYYRKYVNKNKAVPSKKERLL